MSSHQILLLALLITFGIPIEQASSWVGSKVKQDSAIYASQRRHSEQFVKGPDGYMHYHLFHAGKWVTDKKSFRRGGKVAGPIAAIYNPHLRHSEAVFRGTDGYLRHFYIKGAWRMTRIKVAGKVTGNISAVYEPQRKHVGVYFRGSGNTLRYTYFHAGKWRCDANSFRRGGKIKGAIAAVYDHKVRHSEAFFHGVDGFLHRFHIHPRRGWQHDHKGFRKGGKVAGSISAVYAPRRRHSEVVYRGADGYLRYLFRHRGKWAVDARTFRRKGHKVAGAIAALFEPQRNHTAIFYRGTDGYVRYFFISGGWKLDARSFRRGGKVKGPIAAVYSPKRRHAEFYYRSADNRRRFFYISRGWKLHTWDSSPTKANVKPAKPVAKKKSKIPINKVIQIIYAKVPILKKLLKFQKVELKSSSSGAVLTGDAVFTVPKIQSALSFLGPQIKTFTMKITVTFKRPLKIEYVEDRYINELKHSRTNQFELKAISKTVWDKPFHIPFLQIKKVGFEVKYNVNKKKFELAIVGTTKVGDVSFPGRMYLKVEGGQGATPKKTDERKRREKAIMDRRRKKGVERRRKKVDRHKGKTKITDFSISLPNGLDLSKIPGLNKIPLLNEFAFRGLKLGMSELAASVVWKKYKFRADAVLVYRSVAKKKPGADKKSGGNRLFALRLQQVSLGMLNPNLPPLLKGLKFPTLAIVISENDRHNDQVSVFPSMTQKIFKGIANPSDFIPIQSGINIFGIFSTTMLPAGTLIRKALEKELGLKGRSMILAGAIGGFKKKSLKLTLSAMLPRFSLPTKLMIGGRLRPNPLRKFISLAQSSLFFRVDVAKAIIQVGVTGGIIVNMPRVDNPKKLDPLKLKGDLYIQAEAGKYGIRVVGNVVGRWREPLGIGNIELSNPAVLVGYGSGNNVAIGFGGTARIKNAAGAWKEYSVDFITNVIISKVPIINKLGFRLRAAKLGLVPALEIADQLFKGVFLGPMSKFIINQLPPKSRGFARTIQKRIKSKSLMQIYKVDQIPLPLVELRDVDLYFATPNATIPGRGKTLTGMGLGIAAKAQIRFMGKIFKIGAFKNFLTLADGYILKGHLEPRKLGQPPFQFNLKAAKVDIKANFSELPHFKVHGDIVDPLGSIGKIKVELSSKRAQFLAHLNIKKILKLYVNARTIGSSILTATDFKFDAHSKDTLESFVKKSIVPGLPEPFRGMILGLMRDVKKALPFIFKEVRIKGSLVKFVTGKQPATVYIKHLIHGKKVRDINMRIKPVWKAKSQKDILASLFPLNELAQKLVNSYMHNSPIGPGAPFDKKMLIHKATGKCLQAAGQGKLLSLGTCNDRNRAQRWKFNKSNHWQLKSSKGLCADAAGGGILHSQQKLQVWSCTIGTNQKWKVKGSEIQSMLGAYCWEVAGTRVILAKCNKRRTHQQWRVASTSRGVKAIKRVIRPARQHTICLRTKMANKYVGVTTHGLGVMAKADACLAWETFRAKLGRSDLLRSWVTVSIHGHKGYWSAQGNGGLQANRGTVSAWEKFRFYKIGAKPGTPIKDGDTVAIYSLAHKRWLKFHKGGSDYIRSDSKHPKVWEQFRISFR